MLFGDGTFVAQPLGVYEHKEDADTACKQHSAGTAEAMNWRIVSPAGQDMGRLGDFLGSFGVMQVGYDHAEADVKASALLVPEKRIILPGN